MGNTSRSGHPLAQLREALGITQEQLAFASGMSRNTIARNETGTVTLTTRTSRQLASALGSTPERFEAFLLGKLPLNELLPEVRWPGAPKQLGDTTPEPRETDDEAIASINKMLRDRFVAGGSFELSSLDTVRRWLASIGHPKLLAETLTISVVDRLFIEADVFERDASTPVAIALIEALAREASMAASSDDDEAPPV